MLNEDQRVENTGEGVIVGIGQVGDLPHGGEDDDQSQFSWAEHRDTSAVALLSEMKIAIAQPLRNTGRNACGTGAERGVFRIVDDRTASNHETLPRNCCFTDTKLPLTDAWGCKVKTPFLIQQ